MFCANLGAVITAAAGSTYWLNTYASSSVTGFAGTTFDSANAVFTVMEGSAAPISYAVKYNAAGAIQWQREIDLDYSSNVAVSAAGEVYVTNCNNQGGVPLILKLSSTGTLVWSRSYSAGVAQSGYNTNNPVFFDTTGAVFYIYPLSAVLKFTAAGALTWQRNIAPANGVPVPMGGGTDSSNNVYAGVYDTDFSDGLPIIAKFNSAGTLQWQKLLTLTGYGTITSNLATWTDSAGNVYVAVQDTITKLNTSGVAQWQRTVSGAGSFIFSGVTDSATGDVYVAGATTVSGVAWGLVIKINSAGTLQWARRVNQTTPVSLYAFSVVFSAAGTIAFNMRGAANAIVTLHLPSDGSKTGTYAGIQYVAASNTLTTTTATVSAGTASITTPTGTFSAGALTSIAASNSNTLTPIP